MVSFALIEAARRNLALERTKVQGERSRTGKLQKRIAFCSFILKCNAQGMTDKDVGKLLNRPHATINAVVQREMASRTIGTRIQLFLVYIKEGRVTNDLVNTPPTTQEITYFMHVNLRTGLDDLPEELVTPTSTSRAQAV